MGDDADTADNGGGHVPVLLERVVDLLAPALQQPGSVLVDATVGLGGHSGAILDRCPQARVIGLDRDPVAVALARSRLARFGDRVHIVRTGYDAIADVVVAPRPSAWPSAGPSGCRSASTSRCVEAVLFDLGVSSVQLDRAERGFSYSKDAPLDMRMDGSGESGGLTAAELLNTWSAGGIARVLRDYGEERFARRIAAAVVRARADEPFTNSSRLVDVVRAAVPAATRRTGGNPAKRTFQALRIAVNDELAALRRALPAALDCCCLHGRVVVLAYHSLEDRIVKTELASRVRSTVPDDLPVIPPGHGPQLRLLTRGAEQASEADVATNPRSRSVRLRAAERIAVAA
ncbi:MAG: 16S rRNA (cytosine(1402)-N(4))-methyltransferase RsmH [Nocardioidaceae bacterium]|nr:16S rRNA (cytosine(1402)-N(4))-methyltransferase RsmH [Nocardioidaceae bacterium]